MADPQGNGAPEAPQGKDAPEAPQYMTVEQFGQVFNAAFSAREQKARERAEKDHTALLAKLDERFASFKPATPEPPADKPKGEDKPAPVDPEVAKLRTEFAKVQSDLAAANARAAAERKSRVESDAMATVQAALRGKVRDEAVPWVISGLRDRRALTIAEDGSVTLKVRAAPAPHMPEEDLDLPLAEAVPLFLKTKEAALFLPPPSGGAGGTRQPASTKLPTPRLPSRPEYASPARTESEMAARARADLAALGTSAEDLIS